jgi:hypothetical protein
MESTIRVPEGTVHMRLIAVCALVAQVVILFCPLTAGASDLDIGLEVGLGMTQGDYSADGIADEGSKYGPGIFGGFAAALSPERFDHLSLEAKILFWQRGGETAFEDDATGAVRSVTYDFRLSYLALPVSLRYSFSGRGRGLYASVGAEVALLLAANLEHQCEWAAGNDRTFETEDVRDYFTDTDWSVLIAAGYDFPFRQVTCFIALSYTLGLTDVLDPSDAMIDVKIRNRSAGLSLGIWL